MAIDNKTHPATTFQFYIASEATLGTINTVASDYIRFDVNSINDVDWTGGIISDDSLKSGQRYKRDNDIFRTTSGSLWTWDFEYVASDKNAVDLLMSLISETAESPYTSSANSEPAIYADGATTGKKASILIRSPRSGDDRALTGAVLTQLSVAGDQGSDGSRIKYSGQFMTGYRPTVATNATITALEGAPSASKSRVDWEKTVFMLDTKQFDGSDIVLEKFDVNFNFPSSRIGWDANGNPQVYGRGGPAIVEGTITAKYDDNVVGALANFEAGSSVRLLLSGSNGIGFTFGSVVPSAYNPDFSREEAAFIDIPWEAVGTGSQEIYRAEIT